MFERTGSAWGEIQRSVASDGAEYENFGIAVGLSSGTAMAGAYDANVGANAAQGAAYFYSVARNAVVVDGFDGAP